MPGEELRQDPGLVVLPPPLPDAEQEEHHPDGDDDPHFLGRLVQVAHDEDVDEHAEERRQHEDDEHHGERHRPVVLDRELPVGEGGDHADGAVGEVEDPRRHVGDDEAGGRQGVDAPDDDADDREAEERRH